MGVISFVVHVHISFESLPDEVSGEYYSQARTSMDTDLIWKRNTPGKKKKKKKKPCQLYMLSTTNPSALSEKKLFSLPISHAIYRTVYPTSLGIKTVKTDLTVSYA